MTQEEWLKTVEASFFDVITKSNSLGDLVDYAYTLLQNPIVISNERGEILSKSQYNWPYHDALWEEFDSKGYIPREKRNQMSTVHFHKMMRDNQVVILEKYVISHRLMLYQTYMGERFMLRGLMLESKHPFSELDQQIFALFVKSAAYQMQDSEMVRNFRKDTFEFFLFELMHGRIDSVANETEIGRYLELEHGGRLSLLVAKVTPGSAAATELSEARDGLAMIFPDSVSVIDGDLAVLFIRAQQSGYNRIQDAEQFLKKNNMCGCISRSFGNVKDIAEHYRQTATALNLALRLDGTTALHFFSDLFALYLMRDLTAEEQDALFYPPLLPLLDRDKSEGSELLLTVYAYALSFGSCATSAKLLGIHYNSMKNRLSRIQKLMEVDLDEVLPAIYLSVQVLFMKRSESVAVCRGLDTRWRLEKGDRDDL